jgi:hypothetical protein
LLSQIAGYFSLARPVYGASGIKRELVLYTGVLAGVIGQWLIAALTNGSFVWVSLLLGFVASLVTYPAIYNNAGLNRSNVTFVKWCVAFQNGYFWPALFEQVGKGFDSPEALTLLTTAANLFSLGS